MLRLTWQAGSLSAGHCRGPQHACCASCCLSQRRTHGRSKTHPSRAARTPTARAPGAPPRCKTGQPSAGCGAPVDMPDEQQRRPVAHSAQHEEEGIAHLRARPGRSWAGCAPRARSRLLAGRPRASGPPRACQELGRLNMPGAASLSCITLTHRDRPTRATRAGLRGECVVGGGRARAISM